MCTIATAKVQRNYNCDNVYFNECLHQNGYADVFLRPRCEIFTDMEHSYIIELKYLKSQATEAEVKASVKQAEAQLCRYAETMNVNDNIGHTTLHKVYVVYRGVEMVACEEVETLQGS